MEASDAGKDQGLAAQGVRPEGCAGVAMRFTLTIDGITSVQDADVELTVAHGGDAKHIQMTFAGSTGVLMSMHVPLDRFLQIARMVAVAHKHDA